MINKVIIYGGGVWGRDYAQLVVQRSVNNSLPPHAANVELPVHPRRV